MRKKTTKKLITQLLYFHVSPTPHRIDIIYIYASLPVNMG